MDINKLRNVIVDEGGFFKYIVVMVTDVQGREKRVIRSNKNDRHHAAIFYKLQQEIKQDINLCGLELKCIGGGKIDIHRKTKTCHVQAHEFSGTYGQEPDRNETIRLVKVAFPDFTFRDNP